MRAGEVEILQGDGAIDAVAATWAELEAAYGVSSPFQSLTLARVAAKAHARAGETPRIVVVREKGRPVVLFPTVLSAGSTFSSVRFLGDPLIQYGDAITAPDALTAHLATAWSAVADSRVASAVLLRKVRQDSRISPFLNQAAHRLTHTEAPFVDLRSPNKVAKKHAREVERLRRRLGERGETRLEFLRGESVGQALAELMEFKKGWLSARALSGRVLGNSIWEDALIELAGKTCAGADMVAARLTVGGAVAAIELGFADRKTWFAYIGAGSPHFAKLGPGHVQTADTIARCRSEGLACYDLLPPSQPYKRVLATGAVEVVDYGLALNVLGLIPMLAVRSLPHAKAMFNRLPIRLRRFLVSRLS